MRKTASVSPMNPQLSFLARREAFQTLAWCDRPQAQTEPWERSGRNEFIKKVPASKTCAVDKLLELPPRRKVYGRDKRESSLVAAVGVHCVDLEID